MTERVFVSQSTGPIALGLDLPIGSVEVQVSDSVTIARVILRTADTSGPAAEAIASARSHQDGQSLAIEVPDLFQNVMVQSGNGRTITQNFGTVYGSVTGMTIINGRIVSGGNTLTAVAPIEARIILPAGSLFALVSTSADATVHGALDQAEFRSTSGNLRADTVRQLRATTVSGDVRVQQLTEQITARTVSGDIAVGCYSGRDADLDTTSGDVYVTATDAACGPVRANTVSGDVRVSGGRSVRVSAHSVSGHVRTR
ncbi:DUF4097 family beta strand repeat-containing protein [Streptomyces rimosus]|uniref:DUF4097 family beta strand repeat-containing protein n=1 Tax=Streptomyces rimosus TaxID=1927 RepID=UPI0005195F25|nr:DUF4097 family beta strand repeat-containing protein [Streptomyces rimosus]